jgi:phosphatidylglycerol---prolipoprotein diacylglyceryl transferase
MTHFLQIVWNPSEGIQIGSFTLHFYSLMFVVAFMLGWFVMKPIFKRENEPVEKLDSLLVYMVAAILIGARLGDVIFYNWSSYYPDHILEIFLPIRENPNATLFYFIKGWEFTGFRGLASHGAAISVIITMYFYTTKVLKRPILWILDRIVIPVASGAIFVRLGNFFNSEIYGPIVTGKPFYGVKFIREDEFWMDKNIYQLTQTNDLDSAYNAIQTNPNFVETLNNIPFRHPSQLYEAFGYVFVFAILFFLYWKTNARQKSGFIFGMFLITLFSVRILVEFVKESQGGFESVLGILSTGQWLSIPFVLIGSYFVFRPTKQII